MKNVRKFFEKGGGIVEGDKKKLHFGFSNGGHSTIYLDGEHAMNAEVSAGDLLLESLTNKLQLERGINFEVVVGPERGGIVIANRIAYHSAVYKGKRVSAITAIKADGRFVIRPQDHDLIRRMRVLVVNDVCTTGGSINKTTTAVKEAGGNPIAAAVLWDRGGFEGVERSLGLDLIALCSEKLPVLTEEECVKTGPCSLGWGFHPTLGHRH